MNTIPPPTNIASILGWDEEILEGTEIYPYIVVWRNGPQVSYQRGNDIDYIRKNLALTALFI